MEAAEQHAGALSCNVRPLINQRMEPFRDVNCVQVVVFMRTSRLSLQLAVSPSQLAYGLSGPMYRAGRRLEVAYDRQSGLFPARYLRAQLEHNVCSSSLTQGALHAACHEQNL